MSCSVNFDICTLNDCSGVNFYPRIEYSGYTYTLDYLIPAVNPLTIFPGGFVITGAAKSNESIIAESVMMFGGGTYLYTKIGHSVSFSTSDPNYPTSAGWYKLIYAVSSSTLSATNTFWVYLDSTGTPTKYVISNVDLSYSQNRIATWSDNYIEYNTTVDVATGSNLIRYSGDTGVSLPDRNLVHTFDYESELINNSPLNTTWVFSNSITDDPATLICYVVGTFNMDRIPADPDECISDPAEITLAQVVFTTPSGTQAVADVTSNITDEYIPIDFNSLGLTMENGLWSIEFLITHQSGSNLYSKTAYKVILIICELKSRLKTLLLKFIQNECKCKDNWCGSLGHSILVIDKLIWTIEALVKAGQTDKLDEMINKVDIMLANAECNCDDC